MRTTMKINLIKNIIAVFALTALLPLTVSAQTTTPAASSSGGSEKVDLKKLEDKYWSAKDDEYGVIQNRTFSKAGRFYGAVGYGTLINDPFAKAKALNGYLGWYFNEDFGLELSYIGYDSKQNDTVTAYSNMPTVPAFPDYNLIKNTKTLSLVYTPFYAKMAFMNTAILYFDMGFTFGVGMTDYEIQKTTPDSGGFQHQDNEVKSAQHFEIGIMQQMFINRYLAFRLDLKNTFYTQKKQEYKLGTGLPQSARKEYDKNTNDTTLSFSFMWFFNPPKTK